MHFFFGLKKIIQVSSQWFVKMDGMASQALGAVRSGELRILPDMFEKVWCVVHG